MEKSENYEGKFREGKLKDKKKITKLKKDE